MFDALLYNYRVTCKHVLLHVLFCILDPYVVLSCINASQRCKTLTETLSPKWEETVILDNIRIYGSPRAVVASPPTVVLEFYDKDTIVNYNNSL